MTSTQQRSLCLEGGEVIWTSTLIFPQTFVSKHGKMLCWIPYWYIMRESPFLYQCMFEQQMNPLMLQQQIGLFATIMQIAFILLCTIIIQVSGSTILVHAFSICFYFGSADARTCLLMFTSNPGGRTQSYLLGVALSYSISIIIISFE